MTKRLIISSLLVIALLFVLGTCKKKKPQDDVLENFILLNSLPCNANALVIEGLLTDAFGRPGPGGVLTTSSPAAVAETQQAQSGSAVSATADDSGIWRAILTRPTADLTVSFNVSYLGVNLGSFDLHVTAANLTDSSYVPEIRNLAGLFGVRALSLAQTGAPSYQAQGVSLTDTDADAGQLAGTLTVKMAQSEATITNYMLYWGNGSAKLGEVADLAKTGSDLTYALPADTAIPAGATEIRVYTRNGKCEMTDGLSLALQDNTGPTARLWRTVGTAGFSGKIDGIALAFDSANVPHVAFQDSENGGKATVMKYDSSGNQWTVLGSAGFSAGKTEYIALAIDSGNVPYVAYQDAASGKKATLMKYAGGTWQLVGAASFSAGEANHIALKIDSTNVPHVAYRDASAGDKATLMKYSGSWQLVGAAGFSSGAVWDVALALDSTNVPYVAFRDASAGDKATLMKYSGSWQLVGVAGFSSGAARGISLALTSGNVPYVAFQDADDKATVMTYNGSWQVAGNAAFSEKKIGSIALAFDSSNTAHVAFCDDGHKTKATLMKLSGSSWQVVGVAGFSEGKILFPALAFASSVPYVAYKDFGNSKKATVMKYE